jgi:hypothetical protein
MIGAAIQCFLAASQAVSSYFPEKMDNIPEPEEGALQAVG